MTDGRPPLFGSWKGWYGFLILVLAILIIAFHFLTQAYA